MKKLILFLFTSMITFNMSLFAVGGEVDKVDVAARSLIFFKSIVKENLLDLFNSVPEDTSLLDELEDFVQREIEESLVVTFFNKIKISNLSNILKKTNPNLDNFFECVSKQNYEKLTFFEILTIKFLIVFKFSYCLGLDEKALEKIIWFNSKLQNDSKTYPDSMKKILGYVNAQNFTKEIKEFYFKAYLSWEFDLLRKKKIMLFDEYSVYLNYLETLRKDYKCLNNGLKAQQTYIPNFEIDKKIAELDNQLSKYEEDVCSDDLRKETADKRVNYFNKTKNKEEIPVDAESYFYDSGEDDYEDDYLESDEDCCEKCSKCGCATVTPEGGEPFCSNGDCQMWTSN